jgi:hypothetical protein
MIKRKASREARARLRLDVSRAPKTPLGVTCL